MDRLLIALSIVVAAAVVALVVRSRQRVDSPTQPKGEAPRQLDRADFADATEEWLVVVFSSATCSTCADVVSKAQVLASPAVAVREVEWSANKRLHERYGIDSVPITILADRDGVVRTSFAGPVSASDLWVAVAEARDTRC